MNLQNKKTNTGFTIVELLIVIVVIGILAAITIVAYNGIQKRANTSSAQSAANTIQKKAEAYNAVQSSYPASIANFNAVKESELTGSGITLVAAVSSGNGKNSVEYEVCGTSGGRIRYFDYNSGASGAASSWILLGDATTSSTCTDVV